MRRVERENLPIETASALQRFQKEVDTRLGHQNFDPAGDWRAKRGSQPILDAFNVLKRMAGTRERCMYCVDSEASDIEHFYPKSRYPGYMYAWENLLAACAQCGRCKGTQFPQTDDGAPLLIDPSAEDPWQFLDFDPATGNLNARYLLADGAYSSKGETTVTVLHLDKREGIAAGYRKTYNRLCQLVALWAGQTLEHDYLERLIDADDHGLLGWFLSGSGRNEPSFSRFRERYQEAWAACQQRFC